jgi:hypothetical protein
MFSQLIALFGLTAFLLVGSLDARQTDRNENPADGRVLGVVVDQENEPVAGALVVLGDGRTTESGSDGRFAFARVRPGAHEIAAMTSSCAVAAGDFNVQSGRDALLQLIVEERASPQVDEDRTLGHATRRMDGQALRALGNRSALEALAELAPNEFEVRGSRLALRARAGGATDAIREPLLVLDGVRLSVMVADALRNMHANDLSSLEVHLGSAAGWEFQNQGAEAVIEATMRMEPIVDPLRDPGICLDGKSR